MSYWAHFFFFFVWLVFENLICGFLEKPEPSREGDGRGSFDGSSGCKVDWIDMEIWIFLYTFDVYSSCKNVWLSLFFLLLKCCRSHRFLWKTIWFESFDVNRVWKIVDHGNRYLFYDKKKALKKLIFFTVLIIFYALNFYFSSYFRSMRQDLCFQWSPNPLQSPSEKDWVLAVMEQQLPVRRTCSAASAYGDFWGEGRYSSLMVELRRRCLKLKQKRRTKNWKKMKKDTMD